MDHQEPKLRQLLKPRKILFALVLEALLCYDPSQTVAKQEFDSVVIVY